MDFTPSSTPKKRECPGAPLREKVYRKRLIITNDGKRVRIFPFIASNNDDINSCKRCLFPDKPSKIPRFVKKVKPLSKFALSLSLPFL